MKNTWGYNKNKEGNRWITADCSSESMKARKQWSDILKLKGKKKLTYLSIFCESIFQNEDYAIRILKTH